MRAFTWFRVTVMRWKLRHEKHPPEGSGIMKITARTAAIAALAASVVVAGSAPARAVVGSLPPPYSTARIVFSSLNVISEIDLVNLNVVVDFELDPDRDWHWNDRTRAFNFGDDLIFTLRQSVSQPAVS